VNCCGKHGQGELRVAGVHGSGFTGKTVAVSGSKIAVSGIVVEITDRVNSEWRVSIGWGSRVKLSQ
jgi:hypothetical protein